MKNKKLDKKKFIRIFMTWLVTFVMTFVFTADIVVNALCNKYVDRYTVIEESDYNGVCDDRIHFLNTANSDCIMLESNGHFALIDSGEGNRNPRRKTEYKGYEDEVLAYIKEYAKTSDGTAHLDFILATHYHYDHAGNFTAIINDADISIAKAYCKPYAPEIATDMEREPWGNEQTYYEIIAALNNHGIPVISDLPDSEFAFGDFTVKFINTKTPAELAGKGENSNSVGVLIKKSGKTVFLAADITDDSGLEKIYADEIGDVDVLKIGHHGYFGSSSAAFLRKLKPEIAVVTNYLGKIYPNVKWNLTVIAKAPIFSTEHRDGFIISITDSGEFLFTQHTMVQ